MADNAHFQRIYAELEAAIQLTKCQKCGCMGDTLDNLAMLLPTIGTKETKALVRSVVGWDKQMQPIQYDCLGCEHCYPAVAQNEFNAAFPDIEQTSGLSCAFQIGDESWPPVVGEYFVGDEAGSVAVSTLASDRLAEELGRQKPAGLAIVGKTETENIGIDKIIKNVITNPAIRYLIVAGQDSKGHQTGRTLLALVKNGVDANGRVIGSPGKRPILRNVSPEEIAAFRSQVALIDLIGCESPQEIGAEIEALANNAVPQCGCSDCAEQVSVLSSTVETIIAPEMEEPVRLDRAGYFVIIPLAERGIINVEHYDYDNTLLRVIEGTTARAIYKIIVARGWVSELSHAAYLGRELTKAELSLEHGFHYVQDGA